MPTSTPDYLKPGRQGLDSSFIVKDGVHCQRLELFRNLSIIYCIEIPIFYCCHPLIDETHTTSSHDKPPTNKIYHCTNVL